MDLSILCGLAWLNCGGCALHDEVHTSAHSWERDGLAATAAAAAAAVSGHEMHVLLTPCLAVWAKANPRGPHTAVGTNAHWARSQTSTMMLVHVFLHSITPRSEHDVCAHLCSTHTQAMRYIGTPLEQPKVRG